MIISFLLALGNQALNSSAPKPPFEPNWASMSAYRCPEWFKDAKFGIWSVWGPQSVPKQGDWYARKMYQQGDPDYDYQVAHYGHPSKFGYKDIIPLWKAEHWDPGKLMKLYKKAGAKYFVVMAVHHDNYDLWNSKYQPRWNSVNSGPHKDIVGMWRKEALRNGLRFGVTEHNARSLNWLQTSHQSDKSGPLKGVPYDGADPAYQDLYHPPFPESTFTYPQHPTEAWINEWASRTRDLLTTYKPDLFYFDGGVPFGQTGRKIVADFYNQNAAEHGGDNQAVVCVKKTIDGEYVDGTCVQDVERGAEKDISPLPWQTDTCVGDWFYREGIQYKTSTELVRRLVDVVSKNGDLLLNAPLSPEGDLDLAAEQTLLGIGNWLKTNGRAIYGTRPYSVFGEGPHNSTGEMFKEDIGFTDQDIRFTVKDKSLFAIVLGKPPGPITIRSPLSLGNQSAIASVKLLGSQDKCVWSSVPGATTITPPATGTNDLANVFEIRFRQARL
jgi:alpha-L-fucosidase